MSRFVRLTFSDLARLIDGFEWKRKVQAVHVHHTWRPNHAQWQGLKSVEGMWRVHTQTNGWSDIAQHVTVDPEGFVWTGRNWNQPPVSAKGFNGTPAAGPFMFETVGDFDIACDPFGGPQKETVLRITACLLDKFKLGIEAVRFHNEISAKSCPGTAINRLSFLAEVKARSLPGGARARRGRGDTDALTYDTQSIEAVKKLIESGPQAEEPEDSEPDDGPERVFERAVPQTRAMPRGGLSAADRQKLRRHVINSRDGRLSTDGMLTSSRDDVQRIFAEHIPAFAQGQEAGKPLRLAFYAHGGLNSEEVGLQIALAQVDWWLANGVYPLFFVWETGFLETLGQILSPSRAMLPGARGIDELRDSAAEILAHNFGGVGIWSHMKLAAARGVDSGGATTVTVEELYGLLDTVTDRPIELHAVGHSAGSIFHSWFVPAVTARAGTTFKTLSLLAPAIRVDDFAARLLPTMGDAVAKTTIFTMAKDLELADSLGPFYGKSLLYLIYHALESDTEEPILGLDGCLHADAQLRHAFGLMGQNSTVGGSVIWSRTRATSGPDASTATSHGGFDNDVPTMNAVIRRVLGLYHEPLEQEFPAGTRAAPAMVTLRDPIDYLPEPFRTQLAAPAWSVQPAPSLPALAPVVPGLAAPAIVAAAPSGRRRALCVGINAYPTAPLSGCIADAQLWARTLEQLGFGTPLLVTDDDARRERILGELERLIGSSGHGDQVVFQYSGHGTQLDDTDADEDDALDEAICPVDFDDGAFIIDDDFAQVFARIPDGVALTCFFDCCHSGENTRLAVGRPGSSTTRARPRYIRATPQMQEQHKAFRARSGRRGLARSGDRSRMRQVVFSACRPDEVAWENAGQGDFTRLTIPLLGGSIGMPHRQFVDVVIQAFGPARRQTPELDCADGMCDQPLLGSVANGGRALAAGGGPVEAWARVADAMAAALRASS